MHWIEKQARYYKGYLADERSRDDPSRQRGRDLAARVPNQFGRHFLPAADKFVAAPIHVSDLPTRVG